MRQGWPAVVAAVAVVTAVLALGLASPLNHGHRLPVGLATNHPDGFDLRAPGCEPAARPEAGDDDVLIRYLGVSGLWIEWRGEAVMTAPFFSRYGLVEAGLGRLAPDRAAIAAGVADLPLHRLGAVLVGHSHYDHLGDVPDLLGHAVNATVVVNRSGANMLAARHEPDGRVVALDGDAAEPFRLRDATERPLPFRVTPVPSLHAAHWHGGVRFAAGTVDEPWTSWDGQRLRAMRGGETFAFVIDMLRDDDAVAYRIYFQDASAPAPWGIPPADVVAEARIDLAVLCMPGHWLADGFPEGLLAEAPARHVLATHYEDFFAPLDAPPRYVATLTEHRAADLLRTVAASLDDVTDPAAAPDPAPCGPSAATWTMPLGGEWLRFRTDPRSRRSTARPGPA